MPLHDRAETGQHGGPAVQIRRGERPRKTTDVEPPEGDAGHGGGESRRQGAAQLAVDRLLIPGPMAGGSVLPCIASPAEEHPPRPDKIGIGGRITLRVAVDPLAAGAAVGKADGGVADKLAAVGLESIHAHLQQILSPGKPAVHRLRVGKVRDHRPGKPVAGGDRVGRPVGVVHTEPPGNGIPPVQLVLDTGLLIGTLFFVDRDLPQHKMQPGAVQDADHGLGVRPGAVGGIGKIFLTQQATAVLGRKASPAEDVKGGLVAPGFSYQDGRRAVQGFQLPDHLQDLLLAVPMVGRDPGPERPFGRQAHGTEQRKIVADDLRRRAAAQNDFTPGWQKKADLPFLKEKMSRLPGIGI